MNPSEPFTPFLPATTNVPEDPEDLRRYLNTKFSEISDVVNDKKIGMYVQLSENQNGEKWFYKTTQVTRNGYQTIVYLTSVTSQTITLPIQGIDQNFVVTQMWGSASLAATTAAHSGDFFTFVNQGNSKISFTMNKDQIIITTDGSLSSYTGFIVIHYLRDGT